jgi:transposase
LAAKTTPGERVVKDIRRATRRHFSAEDKIRIVLYRLWGEDSIAELCRKEGIAQSLYYVWSKEFMEAGNTARAATTDFIKASSHVLREQAEHMDAPDRCSSRRKNSCTAGVVHTCSTRVSRIDCVSYLDLG